MTTVLPGNPQLGGVPSDLSTLPPVGRTFNPITEGDQHLASARRRIRGTSRDGVLNVAGAAASATCASLLIFGRVAPLEGGLGFVVVTYVLFVATYALLLSFTESRPAVVDRVMAVLLMTAALVAMIALASVILFIVWEGRHVFFRRNFYTQDMSTTRPTDPLTKGGIAHAMLGSLIIMAIALVVTVPLGVSCAVFLTQTRSRLSSPVRTIVDAMTALPSIIAGLFIFATLILVFGLERCGLAAAVAVSIMMLPIVIRSSDVVLRLVPGNLREASAALGAPTWRTVWHVVLPTARSGLTTSVILGVARGVGETAPILLTSGVTAVMNQNPVKGPMMSLPLQAFEFVRSPQHAFIERGYATASVLMILVLVLFVTARILGGKPAGQISDRQRRALARKSLRDLQRFETKASAAS